MAAILKLVQKIKSVQNVDILYNPNDTPKAVRMQKNRTFVLNVAGCMAAITLLAQKIRNVQNADTVSPHTNTLKLVRTIRS